MTSVQAEIMLNLNITISNFLATEAEIKNGVAYNKACTHSRHVKRNIFAKWFGQNYCSMKSFFFPTCVFAVS